MLDKEHRILVWQAGHLRARVPQTPLISSATSQWSGIQLEQHRLSGPAESTGVIEGFQICCNLTGPVPAEWLVKGRRMSATLNPGDLCLATHGEDRTVAWQKSYDLLLLAISAQLMSELSAAAGTGRMIELETRRAFRDPNIQALCRLLLADTANGNPVGPSYGDHLALALASYLAATCAVQPLDVRRTKSSLPGHVLRRICDLIEARLHAPIGLPDMAQEAGMSQFHFSRLFRNSTGESPYRYLLNRRIERAKEMLAQGCNEVEVATATGFSNPGHLASMFRRATGMTPRRFRSSLKA